MQKKQVSDSSSPAVASVTPDQGLLNPPTITPYQRYLQQRQAKETRLVVIISAIMVVLFITSLLTFVGIIRFPFLEGFKSPTKYAMSGSVPCPLSQTPVPVDKLEIHLLNVSDEKGLAKSIKTELEGRKLKVLNIGNAQLDNFNKAARIVTGPTGVNGAYTLARAFPEVEILMDSRRGTDLTVYLGPDFQQLRSAEEFTKLAKQPLTPLPKCLPVRLF